MAKETHVTLEQAQYLAQGIADNEKTLRESAVGAAKEELTTEINKKATQATSLEGYGITNAYTKTETDTAISTAVSNASHLEKEVVTQEQIEALIADPSKALETKIYLVEDDSVTGKDQYYQYMLLGGEVKCTGDTSVSLAGYVKESDISYATNEDIDNILKAVYGVATPEDPGEES